MIAPVVDVGWLAEHRSEVVLADVRWYLDGRSGRATYAAGHLPGAVFVDLDAWLAAHGSPAQGRHPLPEPEVFATGMARLGVGDDTAVVAYDDSGGIIASRLVWMLRVTGHDAALLDGGVQSWAGELERTEATPAAMTFTARPWPVERLADIDAAAQPGPGVTVIDARQRERFLGGPDPVDPRSGHIPGAVSLDCRGNLGADGRLLPVPELRQRFSAVGIEAGADVISYCGSGVSACLNLIAMEHAGLGQGRLYPGSWSQWSHDLDRAVATNEE
jgi:thiosulfate/3-mercaptopyruvate sulfurtransferase